MAIIFKALSIGSSEFEIYNHRFLPCGNFESHFLMEISSNAFKLLISVPLPEWSWEHSFKADSNSCLFVSCCLSASPLSDLADFTSSPEQSRSVYISCCFSLYCFMPWVEPARWKTAWSHFGQARAASNTAMQLPPIFVIFLAVVFYKLYVCFLSACRFLFSQLALTNIL